MTRKEEALKMLRGMKAENLNLDNDYTKDRYDALNMAIKALEQEPCGDAISRAEAIKVASGYCHPANIAKELEKLPSVLPEPTTGVLDKIRAEIGQLPSYAAKFAGGASAIHIDKEEVLQIIDKYKVESEEV